MKKYIKKEKGAIALLVVVTIFMFVLILTGTYFAITNLRKSQLESDLRIQELYGGDVENIEEVYNSVAKSVTNGLEAGDYIQYNSGTNGTILCRVLYPANSEYGLQIISNKKVKNVTLGGSDWTAGKNSYNTAIQTLNNEAEKYINTNYVTDARCVGSIPIVNESRIFVDKDKGTDTTVKLPLGTWSSHIRPDGWTSDDTGCYDTDENYMTDQTQMQNLGLYATEENYWLASRIMNSNSSYATFHVRYVNTTGNSAKDDMCSVFNTGATNGDSHEYGIRPCFSIKTDIKITGGDGSQETPYTME